ncbi:cytochrome c biogenesis protein [Rhizocola hellebori]|uniref:Cytochrome c biogenesis protein n=1 Tax=Rhizocola hellebori TaxID=1392758 RepID=A0A8J3QHI9_9ACTN|nr:cytochrome c biogenesis protein [Rhizocola hellebori]
MLAFLRNSWRQLTSMRTALTLLFLLAVAAIPGSVLPQRSVSAENVAGYFRVHPDLAPVLDRLGFFEVFAAPWFAAIYLLLFTSLVGCVVPRLADHVRALLRPPPAAPARFERLPFHTVVEDPETVNFKGWRKLKRELPDGTVTVSAEKGYLKETGNLLFHSSLLVILVGVGIGAQWGWHANRLLVQGPEQAFCNSLQQFDEYGLGPMVDPGDLPPFCLELTGFEASFLDNGIPKWFEAEVNGDRKFRVNHPLRLDGASVYLLGHGYAPILKYTDAAGKSQTTVSPFLPLDGMLTSEGVAAFPDANGSDKAKQMGFEGLYLPTAGMGRSNHPEERDPALMLMAYRGDLGLDVGISESVYQLNKEKLTRLGDAKMLKKGDTWTLDDGSKLEFLGTKQWITISIRHDPGEPIVLAGVALLLVGLPMSLYGKRRRVWLRLNPDGTAEAGGLPRTDYPGFEDEFKKVTQWPRSQTTS